MTYCDVEFFLDVGSCAITYEEEIGGAVTTEHEYFAKALELRDQCNVLVSCYMPDAPVTVHTGTSTSHEQHVLQRHTSALTATYFVCQSSMDMQRFGIGIARADASMLCTLLMLYMPLWLGMLTDSTTLGYCKFAILPHHVSYSSQKLLLF